MYNKVPTDLKFVEREKEVEKFWADEHIFEKSIKMREGCKPYDCKRSPLSGNRSSFSGSLKCPTAFYIPMPAIRPFPNLQKGSAARLSI